MIELNVIATDANGQPISGAIVECYVLDAELKECPLQPKIKQQPNFYSGAATFTQAMAGVGRNAPFFVYGIVHAAGMNAGYFPKDGGFGIPWDGNATLNITVPLSFKQPPSPPWGIPSTEPFRGAFCIPDALPGIPYGDGKRIWTPAFGCYAGTPWQDAMIGATKSRHYTWFEYQVSGWPYHQDYPELAVDVSRIYADLMKLKQAGLATIIAFDDTRLDLSYLQPVANATQGLVDCVMGIYEVNGVVDWNEDEVIRILTAQGKLWPKAINAFHSTSQDNGGRGFGERPFWERATSEANVSCYFLQQSAWNHPIASTADRASDFSVRLQGPHAGWVELPRGMILFEETTSVTYRTEPESYGVHMIDDLMSLITPRPAGYMDGGTVTP